MGLGTGVSRGLQCNMGVRGRGVVWDTWHCFGMCSGWMLGVVHAYDVRWDLRWAERGGCAKSGIGGVSCTECVVGVGGDVPG